MLIIEDGSISTSSKTMSHSPFSLKKKKKKSPENKTVTTMGIPCALRWGGGLRRKLHIQQAEQSDCRSSQDAPGLGGPTGIPTPQAGFGFGEPSKQERSAASASARRRGRLRALGKTQRHSRGGGGGGRAGGR